MSMQPPALVDPASVSQVEQSPSSRLIDQMSAARAVSRLVKLILRMASMTGRASYWSIATCSTVLSSSSALRLVFRTSAFILFSFERLSALPYGKRDRGGATGRAYNSFGRRLLPLAALLAGRALGAGQADHLAI